MSESSREQTQDWQAEGGLLLGMMERELSSAWKNLEGNGLGVCVRMEGTRALGVVVWNWVMRGVGPVNGDYARRAGQLKCLWESWPLSDLGSKGLGKVGQM